MRILLVEDNDFMLGLFSSFLESEGHDVTGCNSGEEALSLYEQGDFPLVITDIVMPGMDGLELCQRIRHNPKGEYSLILGVTAHESPEMLQKVLSAGADDYLPKPDLADDMEIRRLQIRLEVAARQVQNNLERKKAEEALRESEKELREANATKDKFFSIIAHDLKSPFSGLIPMTEILIEMLDDVDPELKSIAKNLYKATVNTQKLLETLLDWARLQRQQIEFNPEIIDLAEIINLNIELFRENANQKEIELYTNAAPDTRVFGDEKMLTTVIRNLMNNAVKFTRAGGQIGITVENFDNDQLLVVVRDTGVGMNEMVIEKLFRIDESYKTTGTAGERGTGLGLIMCKEFVEKNGGAIWVESRVGEGSEFKFTLPITRPPIS